MSLARHNILITLVTLPVIHFVATAPDVIECGIDTTPQDICADDWYWAEIQQNPGISFWEPCASGQWGCRYKGSKYKGPTQFILTIFVALFLMTLFIVQFYYLRILYID